MIGSLKPEVQKLKFQILKLQSEKEGPLQKNKELMLDVQAMKNVILENIENGKEFVSENERDRKCLA